jgi:hypothetical protein
MADIGADGDVSGGLRPDENASGIPLVSSYVLVDPLNHPPDVFGGIVPSLAGAALHVHTGHAVLHGPQHDVVVEGVAIGSALLLVACSSRHINQYGTRTAAFFRRKNIQNIFGIGSKRNVTGYRYTRVRRVGMQGPVELRRFRDAHSAPDCHQLFGDLRRHLRLRKASRGDSDRDQPKHLLNGSHANLQSNRVYRSG